MESNPLAAVRNNALGTRIPRGFRASQVFARLLWFLSYKAVNPISVMGASKRGAGTGVATLEWFLELHAGSTAGEYSGLRRECRSDFLASDLDQAVPVTVTHPAARRYFHTMDEAVELVLLTSRVETGGGIFTPQLGEPVRIGSGPSVVSDSQSRICGGNVPSHLLDCAQETRCRRSSTTPTSPWSRRLNALPVAREHDGNSFCKGLTGILRVFPEVSSSAIFH